MQTLQQWRPRRVRRSDGTIATITPNTDYRNYSSDYKWERDYPLPLQTKKKSATSITIEFQFDESEISEFREEINSSLNGTLPIRINFMRDGFEIVIAKPGRGSATLNKKSTRIANFVSSRLRFDYVPAVRTANSAESVVRDLVSSELRSLESDPAYEQAMEMIDAIQEPVLNELSESITETVSRFLPTVKRISLKSSQASRSSVLRRSIQIEVDDGVATELSQKGDGVQSLVALALMRHSFEGRSTKSRSIIAIEEPESHLHPKAIRDLRDIIVTLAQNGQVIVSSHSPLLVRWSGNTSTIIVGGNKAFEANKISEVRECLGVMVSDNLSSVEFSLIVEGLADKVILTSFIERKANDRVKKMFRDERFGLEHISGAGKVGYKVSSSEQNILGFHIFLDNDPAAKSEIDKLLRKGAIKENQYTLCSCAGMNESEIEDTIDFRIYKDEVFRKYGVDLDSREFRGNRKWSERIRRVFQTSGKIWNDHIATDLKTIVAQSVKISTSDPFIENKSGSLMALINTLNVIAEDS